MILIRKNENVNSKEEQNELSVFKQIKNDKYTLTEIKADKMPIGIHQKNKNDMFTNHIISLKENDRLYMFTDGYIDQFGGAKGRKFLSKGFKSLLMEIQNEPIDKQKQILESTFENWKKGFHQIDDVLVMGIQIGFKN